MAKTGYVRDMTEQELKAEIAELNKQLKLPGTRRGKEILKKRRRRLQERLSKLQGGKHE